MASRDETSAPATGKKKKIRSPEPIEQAVTAFMLEIEHARTDSFLRAFAVFLAEGDYGARLVPLEPTAETASGSSDPVVYFSGHGAHVAVPSFSSDAAAANARGRGVVPAPAVSTLPMPNNPIGKLGGAAHALARGEARLIGWTRDGTLVEGRKLEQAWGLTRQALDAARRRNELFSLWIKGKHWYPGEALKFERSALAELNRALGQIDPSSKLLFLLRKHGALGGKMAADAAASGRLPDVVRLAKVWSNT